MAATRFNEVIYHQSLRFKDPALESSYQKQKELDFARKWPRGIVLMIMAILLVNAIIRFVKEVKQNTDNLFAPGLAVLLTGLLGVGFEFITHALSCLQYIRGLFLCIGATLAGAIYGTYLYTAPVLMPGALMLFILAIFGNLYFAYDWRLAVLNQLAGHTVMTTFLAVRYVNNLCDAEVFIPLININVLLFILPLLFYFAERDKRQIAFHPSRFFLALALASSSFIAY